jgi:ribosomal protein S12 methylthiotransferase
MAEQHRIARELSAARVGQTLRVLVEREAEPGESAGLEGVSPEHGRVRSSRAERPWLRGRWVMARGEHDAPDIDGRVYVKGDLPLGEFARVRIVGHTDYDLLAEPAE